MSFFKKFFRKLCCGCCCRENPLEDINESTRLLPAISPKDINEKTEIIFFGLVPKSLQTSPFDVSNFGTFTNYKINKIVFSMNHGIIMFSNVKNELAFFGSNENGQLGIKIITSTDGNANQYNEIKLQKFEIEGTSNFEFLDISVSDIYTLVLIRFNDQNKYGKYNYLYKFGLRNEEARIELNDDVKLINREDLKYDKIGMIKQIFTSEHRDVILLDDNTIMLKGTNLDLELYEKFKLIVEDFLIPITQLCLGKNFILLMTEAKQVYAIGDNEYGELGIPNMKFVKIPTLVEFFEKNKIIIKKISVGARHSLVLSEDNKVYSMGDNSEGQCGGFCIHYAIPNKIKFPGKSKIVDIYAGYNHSIALASTGEVYSWGDTSSDKLGYHTGLSTQNNPKIIPFMYFKNVSLIATGPMQTALVTSTIEQSLLATYTTI